MVVLVAMGEDGGGSEGVEFFPKMFALRAKIKHENHALQCAALQ